MTDLEKEIQDWKYIIRRLEDDLYEAKDKLEDLEQEESKN